MAFKDLLSGLTGGKETITQADILNEFRSAMPEYAKTPDEELAPKIASKYSKYYGFLSDFKPDSSVPPEAIQRIAKGEVDKFKKTYPRYADIPTEELAARMEESLPESYSGLGKLLNYGVSQDQGGQDLPLKIESPATKRDQERLYSAVTSLLPPTSPAIYAIMQLPGVKEEATRKLGSAMSGSLGSTADMLAAIPAAAQFVFGSEGPTKSARKVADLMRKEAQDLYPDDPTFMDKLSSGAGSMAMFAGSSLVGGEIGAAAGAAAKGIPLISKIPAMGKVIQVVGRSLGGAVPNVAESATEAGGVYNDALSKGQLPEDASVAAARTFAANIPLIAATNIFPGGGKWWREAIMSAPKEGIQEFMQSLISDVANKDFIDWPKAMSAILKDPQKRKEAVESGIIGAVLGSGTALSLSTLTHENVEPGTLKKITDIPALANVALNREYPVDHLRLVQAAEDSADVAHQAISEGKSPEQASVEAISSFTTDIEAISAESGLPQDQTPAMPIAESIAKLSEDSGLQAQHETLSDKEITLGDLEQEKADLLDRQAAGEQVDSKIMAIDQEIAKLNEPAQTPAQAPQPKRRMTKKAKKEIRAIASQIRSGDLVQAEAGKDPFIEWAKQTKFRANEDVKEEARGVPLVFKSNKGPRLDEFAQMAVNEGLLPEGTTGDQALERLKNYTPQKALSYQDALAQAEDIYFSRKQERSKAKDAVDRVLQGNAIDDHVVVQLTDMITADPEAYQKGYGESYSAEKTQIKGAYYPQRYGAIVKLANGATDFTGYHEAFHAVQNLLATPEEQRIMDRAYRDEAKKQNKNVREVQADAFAEHMKGKSTGVRFIDRVFAKIEKFLRNLGAYFKQRGFTETLQGEAKAVFEKYGRLGEGKRQQGAKGTEQYSADSLFPEQKQSLEERYAQRVREAQQAGMNPQEAAQYAKAKLAAEQQTVKQAVNTVRLSQTEFDAGGVRGFGRGSQGEGELPLYSAEDKKAPVWVFPIEKTVADKMPNRMGADALLNMIRNTPGVKQEEIEWSGLKEFLAGRETITRKEVVDFLEANRLNIREVVLERVKDKNFSVKSEARWLAQERGHIFEDLPPSLQEEFIRMAQETPENSSPMGYTDNTKFSRYTLPGGENYRELLFTLPLSRRDILNPSGVFQSSHFTEPNILAHVRFNERTDTNGKRTLFIEEIQSDWHQKGRETGYISSDYSQERENVAREKMFKSADAAADALKTVDYLGFDGRAEALSAIRQHPDWKTRWDVADNTKVIKVVDEYLADSAEFDRVKNVGKIPDAPLKKTWHEFVLKRMLRYAADNGFEQVAWTTGEQQAERYNLSRYLNSVQWKLNGNKYTVIMWDKTGRPQGAGDFSPDQLSGAVGKELARKIMDQSAQGQTFGLFKDLDLKVGGEGMAGFYDKIIPDFLGRYTKKWGGRIGETNIDVTGQNDLAPQTASVHAIDVNSSMRDSVIYAGQPLYSAEKKGVLELPAAYREAAKYSKPVSDTLDEYRQRKGKEINSFKDYILTTTSRRLGNIHPSLKRSLRQFEYEYRHAIAEDMKTARPVLEALAAMKKNNQDHWIAMDLAMKNGDTAVVDAIANHYGIDMKPVTDMLNRIHERIREVGYKLGYLPGYFPRMVKDMTGFLNYLQKQGKIWGEIEGAIRDKELYLNRALTTEERVNLINSFIRGYVRDRITLARTGNMKTREIEQLTPGLNQYYYDSIESLVRYIAEVNEAVEARRFFGRVEAKPYVTEEEKKIVPPLSDAQKQESALSFNNLEDSIGAYVNRLLENKLITPDQQAELARVIRARFSYQATSGMFGLFKNVMYMDTIASPISAISQLDDLGVALYRSAWDTPGSFIRAAADKSKIGLADLGLENLSEEVRESSASNTALRVMLRSVGFSFLDRVGKETYLNASIDKYRRDLREGKPEAEKAIYDIFGAKSDEVIADLKAGKTTPDILFLAFNELSEAQPITLAEVPQAYLENPGGRLFYALKTFMVKRLDFLRNETRKGKTTPEQLQRFLKLYAYLIVSNGAVNELKDFILGRSTPWSDKIVNALAAPFGIGKFFLYKLRENPIDAVVQYLTPPAKFVHSAIADLRHAGEPTKVGRFYEPRQLEITQDIPIGGKTYYWWYGRGAQKMRAQAAREASPAYRRQQLRKPITEARKQQRIQARMRE